jgi:hypothetical protein
MVLVASLRRPDHLGGQVADAAGDYSNDLARRCIERWVDMLMRRGPTRVLERSFFNVDNLSSIEPRRGLLAENLPGPLPLPCRSSSRKVRLMRW